MQVEYITYCTVYLIIFGHIQAGYYGANIYENEKKVTQNIENFITKIKKLTRKGRNASYTRLIIRKTSNKIYNSSQIFERLRNSIENDVAYSRTTDLQGEPT